MDESQTANQLQSLSDAALIEMLRLNQCELFLSRTGQLSVYAPHDAPEAAIPVSLIREVFRRRFQLLPHARVNGIRLRERGAFSDAA